MRQSSIPASGGPAGAAAPYQRSILVVEDEPLLRDALGRALETWGYSVVTVASAPDARRAFVRIDPDALVLDVDLGPGPSGFDLADALLEHGTGVAVVFLTNLPDARFAGRPAGALPPGVAYLRKSAVGDLDLLARTIDAALRGAVDPSMRHDRDPARPFGSLSDGQVEVLRLIADGHSNVAIAADRGIGLHAAEKAVTRIFAALGIEETREGNSRVAAAKRFFADAGRPIPAGEERDAPG